MTQRIIMPNGVPYPYSRRELEAMRDSTLAALKQDYELKRRQILGEYKLALENYGHAPIKRMSK